MMATIATINNMGSFAHNPRGNLWFNDDSSYGHKLLLKMGWSKGKGLGKQENGIKENIKVKFRNTNSGLGFKDDSYGNVMKTEYDSILKSLSAEYQQQNTVNRCSENLGHKNSKQKAKFVKCRIRYPKLYYGKDVSKYSEKDMKSIFLCSLPTKENEEEKSGDCGTLSKKENGNQVSNLYETHNSQLSISDYFNLKMKQKTDNKLIKQEIKSESEPQSRDFESSKTGNKFVIKEENRELESIQQENAVLTVSKKKKRKKTRNSESSTNSVDKSEFSIENDIKQNTMTLNVGPLELKNSDSRDDFPDEKVWGLSNSISNQLNASNRKRKRSHKNENLDTSEGNNSSLLSSEVCSDSLPLVPNKKRKKLNKNSEYKFEDSVELLSVSSKDEVPENGGLVDISKSSSLQVRDMSPTNNYESTKKSKNLKSKLHKLKNLKSCLKNKKDSYNVKNVSFHESISYRLIDSDKEYTDSLAHCQEISQNNSTPSSDSNCGLDVDSDGECVIISDSSFREKNENNIVKNESESEERSETENCDSKSGLPSSSSSLYNDWVESQTQAMKMKMYKKLLKNIKKHDILKTSNLLSIKGYGNWGFKK